jgi:hypothetical protein
MRSATARLVLLGLILLSPTVDPTVAAAQTSAELDAYWAEVSRTVAEGDFEGYSRLYHPDAVLVSTGSSTTLPISSQLVAWESDFITTREGKAEAGVAFRFTKRLHDDTTAHETGIFRYTLKVGDGMETVGIVHFEGLLVKKDGMWLMMMEYQKPAATQEEWESLR